MICSVATSVVALRNCCGRVRSAMTTSSSDGVAGALAEAVDGDLDLPGAGLDAGQRVGRGEAEIVVAVGADDRAATDEA